jgi:hypothetical protein
VISVNEAITRFRRDVTVSTLLKVGLGVGAAVVTMLHFLPKRPLDPTLLLMLLGVVWLALWYRTMKGSRLAAESSSLIALGRLEQAEAQIEQSLRAFSMSRSVKSVSLLNLALVRLAQKRWPDAALLCREVLAARQGGTPEHVSKSGRLMLADSLLEMGDLRGTYEAIAGLYQHKLTLGEALNLLRVQTDYLARIGAWGAIFDGVETKAQMAEIMTAGQGVRVQAILALAARRVGRRDWEDWLRRRVELLADVSELTRERPLLWELWEGENQSAVGSGQSAV